MDLEPIISGLLSGTTLIGIAGMIMYYRENKKLKQNEVALKQNEVSQASVETQKAEIDLGNLYKEEMVKVINLLKENQLENVGNQKTIIERLDGLEKKVTGLESTVSKVEERVGKLEETTGNIVVYNGEYQEHLAKRGFK